MTICLGLPDEESDVEPWIEDKDLGMGTEQDLGVEETKFWEQLIGKYLYPLATDEEHEERVGKELKSLRNKAVTAFFLIDFLIIVLIETLEQFETIAGAGESNFTTHFHYRCRGKDLSIDPIGFAFIVVFGAILVIQLLGMLAHRFFTLLQIVSTTRISNKRKGVGKRNEEVVTLAKQIMMGTGDDADNISLASTVTQDDEITDTVKSTVRGGFATHRGTRMPYSSISKRLNRPKGTFRTLDAKFRQGFQQFEKSWGDTLTMRNTMQNAFSNIEAPSVIVRKMSRPDNGLNGELHGDAHGRRYSDQYGGAVRYNPLRRPSVAPNASRQNLPKPVLDVLQQRQVQGEAQTTRHFEDSRE